MEYLNLLPIHVGIESLQTPSPSHFILCEPEISLPHIQENTTFPPKLLLCSKSCNFGFDVTIGGQTIASQCGTSADHLPKIKKNYLINKDK